MRRIKTFSILFYLCLVGSLIAACTGTTQNPLEATQVGPRPTAYEDLPFPVLATLGPEMKRFSGQGNSTEMTITLNTKQFLRVNWKQRCLTNFYLSLMNTDPALAENDDSEIIMSVAANPSYGYNDYEFEPGTYKINIESDGPWEIWIDSVVQEQEVILTDEPSDQPPIMPTIQP